MQSISRNWNLRTAAISIGVVACLCFSIGEGLRLTPFPVSVFSEAETLNETENSLHRYGPLDVPSRAQLRGKRQVVDYAVTQQARIPEPQPLGRSNYRASFDLKTIHAGSIPIGRAPPAC